MHVLFQKIWAFVTTVSVKDSKIAASWPSSFEVRLSDVHDDGHTIFVIILNESVEGIDSVTFDCSIAAFDKFDRLDSGDGASLFLLVLIHLILTIISI